MPASPQMFSTATQVKAVGDVSPKPTAAKSNFSFVENKSGRRKFGGLYAGLFARNTCYK
jgi:hypothetical protein